MSGEAEPKKKSSSSLKAAFEALSKGNYEETVRLCKQVVKQPGGQNNYEALVLLGKALFCGNQYDHAQTAYRRAVDLNPSAVRAWQGLAELYEASENFDKVLEACESIIEIAKATDDKPRLTDYLCRLARAHVKSLDYEKASQTWNVLLGIPSISETQRVEALCGVADAQVVQLINLREQANRNCLPQREPACSLGEIDIKGPVTFPASIGPAVNAFSVDDTKIFQDKVNSLERLLREIVHISPQTHRYQDLLLKLLLNRMQEAHLLGGEMYKKAQLQVLHHSVAMLSFYCSDAALEIAFTMCEEDCVDQIFGAIRMERSRNNRQERILWLGKRFAHSYPHHGASLAVIAYSLHCRSIFSLQRTIFFCERALKMDLTSITGWQVLAELRLSEKSLSSVQLCVTRGKEAIYHFRKAYGFSLKVAELRLQLVLANAYLASESHDESAKIFSNIAESAGKLEDAEAARVKFAAFEGLIKICLAKEVFEEAECKLEELLALDANNHWALAELGWLVFQRGDFDNAYTLLVEAVHGQPDIASYHYRLGLIYWKAGDIVQSPKEKAVEQFILTVKLDPHNGDAYRFLGNYYNLSARDKQRATKCYQKCVALNPEDSEAGEALCDILDSGGQETLEAVICHDASQRSRRAFWAWRRMGFIQVQQKKWSDAVASLQHAIRGYPTCADLWEALGLSYQQLGMLTAAIKAYGRAIAIEGSSRVFPLIQSGNIFLLLGSYRKAIEQFQLGLEFAPQNLAAQYGLASAMLGMSKECRALGAFGWAANLTKEASEIALASCLMFGNVAAVWKLLGDIQVDYVHCLPWEKEEESFGNEREAFSYSVCSWKRQRILKAVNAKRAYQHALHLSPWQANLYKDIAISIDLINYLHGNEMSDENSWCLAEVMALGALMLESDNAELWINMGCLSKQKAIQQHAFIRALQVNGFNALAWAHLGKLYLRECQRDLARQAFDHARSADPLLAISWAGMSVHDHCEGSKVLLEAFASCLYAVQLMPAVEFQLGLGKLAASTGQLQSSKVLAALEQAVQHAPQCPESHNLSGLAWESRRYFLHATLSYKRARYAMHHFGGQSKSLSYHDVSLNLARALCQAGKAKDAVNECENLEKTGMLGIEGLQMYAVALWQIGKNDLSLQMVHKAVTISKENIKASNLGLVCKLVYQILGQEYAMNELLKRPRDICTDSNFSLTAFAIAILDSNGRFPMFLSENIDLFFLHERSPKLYSLLATRKQLSESANIRSGVQNGEVVLRKALHMHPQSTLIRNQLGFHLLSTRRNNSHIAVRCSCRDLDISPSVQGSTSTPAMLGAAAIACSNCGTCNIRITFSTCRNEGVDGVNVILQLQRWFHLEPWNDTAWYLLILNVFQKAREEKYPNHLCRVIKQLVSSARWNLLFNKGGHICPYKEFQLLLCISEIYLQSGDYSGSVKYAITASQLHVSDSILFFAHLQLARCYASQQDLTSLHNEYINCLRLRTDCEIGWITLSLLEARYFLQGQNNTAAIDHELFLNNRDNAQNLWMALLELVRGQSFIWHENFQSAENALANACSMWPEEGCLHLIHGAICMELARQSSGSEFLHMTRQSLVRVQNICHSALPMVSLLLAQAEGSIDRKKDKWERNLRLEWSAWPADMKPAELLFQMHLLAVQSSAMSERDKDRPECSKSSRSWLLLALHLNPSCSRYWKALKQARKCM